MRKYVVAFGRELPEFVVDSLQVQPNAIFINVARGHVAMKRLGKQPPGFRQPKTLASYQASRYSSLESTETVLSDDRTTQIGVRYWRRLEQARRTRKIADVRYPRDSGANIQI
jgi:hypothetical protein